ncbi:MAG: aminopeptidase P family protein [Candidatus Tectomicrobia bacterium]|uniref:Aminopeptidase P family protein n=1 Tax=Tectimicrobiota bacterium TaxID=2528274 RepID=A0A933GMW0_UNCTE|nr:aminopeptidase P family protein [Candidatus Tectomicrobia bacterium]
MTEHLSITKDELQRRLENTQNLMQQRDLDGLIVFSSFQEREGHISYLTNHHNAFPNTLSHMGLGHSALVLPSRGLGALVSPLAYEASKVVNIDHVKTGFTLAQDVISSVKEKDLESKRIGLVGLDVIPVEYYESIKKGLAKATFEVANDLLEGQRLIKSPAEIALLRKGAGIADAALLSGMEAATEGASSLDIELAVRKAALEAGADFIPRVRISIGPRIESLTWPTAKRQRVAKGDFVFLDVIGWVDGYGFDNSRIKVVGKADDKQRGYMEHAAEATEWMTSLVKPGVPLNFTMTMSRERQILAVGHGIGLEICENPWLTISPHKATLEPNMVICIEPSVVDRQFGSMCIEDTVLVTETGVEVLNQCPRVLRS